MNVDELLQAYHQLSEIEKAQLLSQCADSLLEYANSEQKIAATLRDANPEDLAFELLDRRLMLPEDMLERVMVGADAITQVQDYCREMAETDYLDYEPDDY